MQTPIMQRLKSIVDPAISYALYLMLKPMTERFRSCMHTSAGLVIKANGGILAKSGSSISHYQAKGKNGRILTSVDMPALSGTVTNLMFNVFVFTIDSAGTKYSYMGTEAATEAAVKWPKLNPEHAIIGYIKINVTGTGNFIGNHATSGVLDSATLFAAPTTDVQFISMTGMSFPGARVD